MWCPSATLSVWANAWLAGRAAPDDVLDALSHWAARQSVTAHDAVAAGSAGLPWPDVDASGSMSLLQTVRAAAGGRTDANIAVILPVPGDVRGLPAGTQFEHDALAAGEAVIVCHVDDPHTAVGLLPELDDASDGAQTLSWTVYALPGAPVADQPELREAEYALRSAVRSAADALTTLGVETTSAEMDDPRELVEHLVEDSQHHPVPDHAPSRALRVLESAALIDAIITVVSEAMPITAHSSSATRLAADALRPLAPVARAARVAASGAILRSAWRC